MLGRKIFAKRLIILIFSNVTLFVSISQKPKSPKTVEHCRSQVTEKLHQKA
jgi:hypothetical protein